MENFTFKALVVSILMMFAPFFANAAHITGGDLTVRHVEGNIFEATLTLYRDCASDGAPFDQIVGLTVYDAVTNQIVTNENAEDPEVWIIFNGFETLIPELGNSCFTPDVCLELGVYQTQFELPDNPNGYYLTKERCCRNDLSINLPTSGDLGFVFTVDVPDPALQNSTPEFGVYPSEAYFCVNGVNNIDFGATDADGDSLVYSFADPFNGASTFFEPDPFVASAKPYSVIPWNAAFSTDDQVGGTPPITINSETGLITAQPDQVGVFTVVVQVQEYRDGVLIGTVRRELQLTSTVCLVDSPSVINTPNGDTIFDMLVNVQTCIPIVVTDPNLGDTLFVQGEGGILDGTVMPQAVFPDANGFSTIEQEFCWTPVCENLQDELYQVTLTAFSRGCANEVLITEQDIYFNVYIEEDETTLLEEPLPGEPVIIDLYDPSTHCFDFVFVDPNDADTLIVNPSSNIFDFDNVNALESEIDQGTVTLPFCWNVICEDVRDEPYFVDFEVIATNCEVQDTVIFSVPINVIVPPDEPASFLQPTDTIFWEFYSVDTFCMPVTFVDPNFFDTLEVTSTSEIFNLPENPASLDTLQGLVQLDGNLCWSPKCSDVRDEPYLINFKGTSESCKTDLTVEKNVVLFLDLPPEQPPIFELPLSGFEIEHSIGEEPIEFDILATDVDPYDTLTLSAQGSVFTDVANIAAIDGITSSVEAVFAEFSWIPDCPDVQVDPHVVTFTVLSQSCQKSVTRTLEVPILVSTPTMGIIEPIQNIFTPNGDGRNEFWSIEDKEDPCLLNFNSVVYDRWGKEVFRSTDPAFMWEGDFDNGNEAQEGQYFHTIEYFYKDATQNYNGTISLNR